MSDLKRIESNVRLMISKGASEGEIDEYLKAEGHTPESFRARGQTQSSPQKPTGPSYTMDSIDVPLDPGENPLRSIGSAAWDIASRVPRFADDVVRRAANSLTFNFADKGAAAANSAIGGGTYADNIKKERQQTADAAQRLGPVGTFAADVGGGYMTGLGAVRAGVSPLANYGARFGTAGKTMLGAAEGGAYGALAGAGSTDNGTASDYLANMATQGVEGAAVGGLLSGVPGVIKDARDWISKSPEAAQRWAQEVLGRAMAWDRGGQRAKAATLGPEATLGDTGPGMRGVAQGVMTRPGEGASDLATTLQQRQAGRAARLDTAVDESLGPNQQSWFYPGNHEQGKQVLVAERSGGTLPNGKEVLGLNPEYTEVWKNAPRMQDADVAGIVDVIDRKMETAKGPMKAALQYMRSQLVLGKGVPVMMSDTGVITHVPADKVGPGMVPLAKGIGGKPKDILETNPEALNNAKIALSNLVQRGDKSIGIEPGSISKSDGNIKYITALIDDMLKTKVPGYEAVTNKSSQLARQVEAVDTGFNALGGGPKNAIWPHTIEETMAADGGKLVTPLRVGNRAQIAAEVGNNPNDLAALKKLVGGDMDWNRRKMEAIWGKDRADDLLNSVSREQTFANTENAVMAGSQTAQRTGASQAIDDTVGATGVPFSMSGIINWAGNKLLSATSATARQSVRDELGKVMSLKGQALDDFLVKAELAAKEREFRNRLFAQRQYGLLGGEQGIGQPEGLTIDMTR